MARSIRAIYESGHLRLLESLDLNEGQEVIIHVDEQVTLNDNQQSLVDLLRSWREATGEEAEDQRETLQFLMKALDEDRLSDRKLFP